MKGSAVVPGDKSISHRALMLASLACGTSEIRNLASGADVLATIECLRALGPEIDVEDSRAVIQSIGTFQPPRDALNAANSGTTMRLLTGILAGQSFASCMAGDASLSSRPMTRIIQPLTRMGAHIDSVDGRAPLTIRGAELRGISYRSSVASAQVKSCLLLAAMLADGVTTIEESTQTRDHTERLLTQTGVSILSRDRTVSITGGQRPAPFMMDVPGDMSSAAFLFAAAAATNGCVTVDGVGVNPTRTAFLDVLTRMGAGVRVEHMRVRHGEPIAQVTVQGRVTLPIDMGPQDVPSLVDELPLCALLATQANGESVVRGATELRVKETDRISGVVSSLQRLGANVRELPDGFAVQGPTPLTGAVVTAAGDHRLAMMLAVAGTIADGETVIEGAEAAVVSFPEFAATWHSLGGRIDAH
jgi:3-phosphoshikimate 1-carboxyvinyltransferase